MLNLYIVIFNIFNMIRNLQIKRGHLDLRFRRIKKQEEKLELKLLLFHKGFTSLNLCYFQGFKPISTLVLTQRNASYLSVYSVKYRIRLRCSYNTTYSSNSLQMYTCPRTIRTRGQVLLLGRAVAGMQEDTNWVESQGFTIYITANDALYRSIKNIH